MDSKKHFRVAQVGDGGGLCDLEAQLVVVERGGLDQLQHIRPTAIALPTIAALSLTSPA